MIFLRTTVLCVLLLLISGSLVAETRSMSEVFAKENEVQIMLDLEAALARAQAGLGIVPQWAADELTLKARSELVGLEDLAAERSRVGHGMVALLNVWQRSIEQGAEEYMHYGATTVDIYDSTLVLQLREAGGILRSHLLDLELLMMGMAQEHRSTLMMGRTLGQHALPITFGKKVSTWLAENRRNIDRLDEVMLRLDRSLIMKGAVGTYLGLGEQGIELERAMAKELGMADPYPDDWHAARDVFAEYALTLAIISRSYGRVGNELFILQMTDIGETEEVRAATVVGSSTMPHKKNPSKSEALIQHSRSIPRLSEVVLDDMVNYFERDNTSRPNRVLAEISIESDRMLRTAGGLLQSLKVNREVMAANVNTTKGLVMAQRITFALADTMGKTTANARMHELAVEALGKGISLREAIETSDDLSRQFSSEQLDELLDPTSYIGLAEQQVDAVIAYCRNRRQEG